MPTLRQVDVEKGEVGVGMRGRGEGREWISVLMDLLVIHATIKVLGLIYCLRFA